MIAKDSGGQDFDIIPAGMYHGICYGLWDLGHQYNTAYNKWEHKIIIGWELPDLRIDIEKDGEMKDLPRVISRKYTLSLSEKAWLHQHLVSWRGKEFTPQELEGFEVKKVLGVNCTINIVHGKSKDGKKTYANIASISPKMTQIKNKKPENPIQYYSMEEHGISEGDIPEDTYEWIVKLIKESKEFQDGNSYPGDNQSGDWSEEDPPPIEEDTIPF